MTKSREIAQQKITVGYSRNTPIYSEKILAAVRLLNREYLDLLVADGRSPDTTLTGFGATTLRHLIDAPRQVRDTIAGCPYVLFRLDPSGMPSWRETAVRDAELPPPGERYAPAGSDYWSAFLNTAWVYAWHLSHHSPLAARIVLGFTPAQVDYLATLELSRLRDIAAARSQPPAPRWVSNPCFWDDLVTCACEQQPRRFDAARLLGMQLLAADTRRG